VIRPARAFDVEAVGRLLTELGRSPLGDATRHRFRSGFLAHLRRRDTASLVAVEDGQVVGFCSLEFRPRLNRMRAQAWIPDLIVDRAARGRGHGRQLLERAFQLAGERGCWSVTLESGHHRQEAHRLYMSAGMEDAGVYFIRQLEADV